MSDHEDHIMNRANKAREAEGKKPLTVEQFRTQVNAHQSTARAELLHDYLVEIVD